MAARKALPKRLEKEIYQQFGSKCPFCGETDVSTLQVHHVAPHAAVREHRAENLLLTCANCHQKIEDSRISARDVHHAKFSAEQSIVLANPAASTKSQNSVTFTGQNHGIVANTVSISASTRKLKIAPAQGTIGAELEMRNYAKYLIDRYHKYKEADVGKDNVRYPVLYGTIKREFGADWDKLSVTRFQALVDLLQHRIDGTKLGRNHKSKSQKRYSSFEEHQAK